MAVLQRLHRSGRDPGHPVRLRRLQPADIITGQDGDEANLKNIVDGLQSMTVYKAVANEAVVTLDLAKAILEGDHRGRAP